MRTYGRTSYSPPVPHQRPKKGGRSLHDDPSGASPAGRVNGPQGRTFLPVGVGGVRRSPLPVRIRASFREGRPQKGRRAASGRKAQGPHHLGAPGTLRRLCAYLPAPLRPPEGESVNPPTLSPLADLAHYLVQASVLLDRLPITLRDRLAEGVPGIFVSAVLAAPGQQRRLPGHRNHSHLSAPGSQPPPQVEVRLRSLFPTRFQPIQPNRFPHWISRARV